MYKAVGFQLLATLLAAALSAALFGIEGAWSALAGGVAVVVPNAFFAFRLAAVRGRSPSAYPAAFFVGEFIKVAATVGLLALAAATIKDLHWGALIIGLVLALKANLFALLGRN
ncbi:ATP synthase subunit I [Nitrogeniibacter mangrovi]|uniref:ATP synthase subunit I n=1 Tax=Nitrogeniibacter mangrovi TaxID=2016596 RepID=A0A6C1B2A6_9RHOO|nr:ATP synthase subunit I [Nitrogeniibacter mangrovi]QID16344.1 ATP synthase subunit I [Nitrogeniibacter mangrovi]